jgi:hypothetical protein
MGRNTYFVNLAGRKRGPFFSSQLRVLYASGSIKRNAIAWAGSEKRGVSVEKLLFPTGKPNRKRIRLSAD